MKKIISILFLALFLLSGFSVFINQVDAYVSVKGYTRKDGTYVAPHVRSNPNGLKFDNYSYTPSQGLYNKTYGTRDSYWDTPTYVTDPDYYLGKSLYESGSSGSSYSSSSYSKVTGGYKSYGVLFCNSGYYEIDDKCKKTPDHSTSYGGSTFYCDTGFVKDGDECIEKNPDYICKLSFGGNSISSNQKMIDTLCTCKAGYKWSLDEKSCEKITSCSGDFILSNDKCISLDESCQSSYGSNSMGVSGSKKEDNTGRCKCKDGYSFTSDMKSCVINSITTIEPVKNYFTNLQFGSNGEDVKDLQNKLVKKGLLTATPNGNFGPATLKAVKIFQANNGLNADGVVNSKVLELLNK